MPALNKKMDRIIIMTIKFRVLEKGKNPRVHIAAAINVIRKSAIAR
jgi:hypothetical protein